MAHLTVEERSTIQRMLDEGHQQKVIAKAIGRCASVVCREIARNGDLRSGAYRAPLAQRKYTRRMASKPVHIHYTPQMRVRVVALLGRKYSPEQIVGVAGNEGWECVSHERIYQHVWQDKRAAGELHTHLRRRGRRYRKRGAAKDTRGIIPGRVDIALRPAVVEQRERFGDLEIDTIIGKGHQGAIVTINDRATGLLRMFKVARREAAAVAHGTIAALKPWGAALHTITADNGKEFALHATIAQELRIGFFFARPYHSWQRGSNENLNGLIRQYIPKKTDFSTLSDEYIAYVQNELNERPRKRLGYRSPKATFDQLTDQTPIAFAG